MKPIQNTRGLTLIELLIAVVVLGVVAAISIISVGNIVENTRVRADEANAITLNQATRLYKLSNPNSTVFLDQTQTSESLIQYLHTQNFLRDLITPLASDGFFTYDFTFGAWLYRGVYIITLDDLELRPSGFYQGRIEGVYEGTSTRILIPDSIDGTTVLSIDSDVFNFFGNFHVDPPKQSSVALEEVIFTNQSQLQQIHARAFRGNNLTSITFPQTLNQIDWGAFSDNNHLVSITIGPNVSIIENNAFRGNNAFRDAYEEHGEGTYVWNGTTWVKE